METSFSPSVNIIRDSGRTQSYIPTANARRIYQQILNDFALGIRAFSIIGSYGTGKSAFLLALERTLAGEATFFPPPNGHFNGVSKFNFVNVVGSFDSLRNVLRSTLDIAQDEDLFVGLDRLAANAAGDNQCIVLVVDEFGKFLEHAAETNPQSEMYFVQQLAEYANDPNRNLLFISVLHQSFSAYSAGLTREDREEWLKVKGRLKELTFNEPVEQLLALAAEHVQDLELSVTSVGLKELVEAIRHSGTFPYHNSLSYDFATKLCPFDLLSASVLTQALQTYGQNERSLFTFLNSSEYQGLHNYDTRANPFFNLACVHDYLAHNYHSLLSTVYNPHHSGWGAIRSSLERVDSLFEEERAIALSLVKTIGLLNIFAPKGARIDNTFLTAYGRYALGHSNIGSVLDRLNNHRIIRFKHYKSSFVLFEGTDLNLDEEILNAGSKIDPVGDVVPLLQQYFEFPYLIARAISYEIGTPRFFEFRLSNEPLDTVPEGVVDGFINLIFSDSLTVQDISAKSRLSENAATLYVWYRATKRIREILSEIEKVNHVMAENPDDRIAQVQLQEIRASEISQLNEQVLDSLIADTGSVVWIWRDEVQPVVNSKMLNQLLSEVCKAVYSATPIFRNELINRHKLSSAAATARTNFFRQLAEHWSEPELGFEPTRYPPEKTLYLSLLKQSGIHQYVNDEFSLGKPTEASYEPLWEVCERFLESSKIAPRQLIELIEELEHPPFKLKQGVLDVWVPLFIFVRREKLALYHQGVFVARVNADTLDLMRRTPQTFQVKAYTIDGVRERIFRRVRIATAKTDVGGITSSALLETIGELIGFYRGLPEYTKRTERLDPRTLKLRDTLATAKEPDTALFEDLPQALGFIGLDGENVLDETIDAYVHQLKISTDELTQCFDRLVDRIEAYLLNTVGVSNQGFPEYREDIRRRFEPLRVHMLLQKQKVFYTRLMSPLDDRTAWLGSLVQAILGKQLTHMRDQDEVVVFDGIADMIHELDNLCDLEKSGREAVEHAVRIEITSFEQGSKKATFRLSSEREQEIAKLEDAVKRVLGSDDTLNVIALARLLQEKINE